jgi:small subunit ribosomal protein S20
MATNTLTVRAPDGRVNFHGFNHELERRKRSVANTKSAIKRIRQNEKRRLRNRAVRSKVRTAVKIVRAALTEKSPAAAEALRETVRALDKAVTKGVIHRNTASRKKSRLARQLAALAGS